MTQRIGLREILQRYGLILSFLALCIILSILSDRFLTINNAVNILRQSTINGIITIAMTYVILTAGIDLSVEAVLALATVGAADLMQLEIARLPNEFYSSWNWSGDRNPGT